MQNLIEIKLLLRCSNLSLSDLWGKNLPHKITNEEYSDFLYKEYLVVFITVQNLLATPRSFLIIQ